MRVGYHLSAEELDPVSMVRWARRAEEAGFAFLSVSDHYHPWTRAQGQSRTVSRVARSSRSPLRNPRSVIPAPPW